MKIQVFTFTLHLLGSRLGELNSFVEKQKSIAEARAELGRDGFAHEHGRRRGHGHGELGRDSGMVLFNEEVKLSSP